ncbi:MAG: hypothetical protein HRU19_11235 [Pseudobacteriovorax sp.]|nr:hypothetical protein [Pseudobacteriovorax sp.]
MKLLMASLMMVAGTQAVAQTEFRIAPHHAYLELPEQKSKFEFNGNSFTGDSAKSHENTAGLALGVLIPLGSLKLDVGLSHQKYYLDTTSRFSFISTAGRLHIPFNSGIYGVAGASLTRIEYTVEESPIKWNNPILFNGDIGLGWSNSLNSSVSIFAEAIHSRTLIGQSLESNTVPGTSGSFKFSFEEFQIHLSTLSLGLGFSL